jgi:uncharacterized protein (TIGR03067 family)
LFAEHVIPFEVSAMKTLHRLVILASCCAALLLLANESFTQGKQAKPDTEEEALKKLQGMWMFEKSEKNGPGIWALPEEAIYIERNVLQHVKKSGDLIFNGSRAEIFIDPSKKPATIDIIRKNGSVGQKILGIFKIEGDRLIIATNTNNQDTRPGQFSTKLTAGAQKATNLQTYKLVVGPTTKQPKDKSEPKKLTQEEIDQAAEEGLKKLQGHWIFEKSERNGFSYWVLPEESLYIEKNLVQRAKKSGELVFNGDRAEITIDPTKNPMTIDFVRKNGSVGQKILGIYKIEGDRLILATNTADDNRDIRPGQFSVKLTAKMERASIVQTYKLAK